MAHSSSAIEVTTDGKKYVQYKDKETFTLSTGKHVIKCRATDRAGNQSEKMTGEWITGSDENFLEVDVQPAGKGGQ